MLPRPVGRAPRPRRGRQARRAAAPRRARPDRRGLEGGSRERPRNHSVLAPRPQHHRCCPRPRHAREGPADGPRPATGFRGVVPMIARIANARMYSVAPGAAAAWRRLFEWVAAESGVPLEIIDHAFPAKLEELWERPDLAATFICGLPFAKDPRALAPIVAPIPAPARYGGKPIYFTDFVVKMESQFHTLADTFGHRLAYTIPSSHSGYNAVRHHLLRYRTPEHPRLYAETVGP